MPPSSGLPCRVWLPSEVFQAARAHGFGQRHARWSRPWRLAPPSNNASRKDLAPHLVASFGTRWQDGWGSFALGAGPVAWQARRCCSSCGGPVSAPALESLVQALTDPGRPPSRQPAGRAALEVQRGREASLLAETTSGILRAGPGAEDAGRGEGARAGRARQADVVAESLRRLAVPAGWPAAACRREPLARALPTAARPARDQRCVRRQVSMPAPSRWPPVSSTASGPAWRCRAV